MADKPSRGLVLYGDGLVRFISPSHTHLHSLASRGSCGFLSLTNPPPSESKDERVVGELAQLLDAYDAYIKRNGENAATLECLKKPMVPTISERFVVMVFVRFGTADNRIMFMGLRAAIFTNNMNVKSFGRNLGFTVLKFDDLSTNNHSPGKPPQDVVVSELLKFLGFQGGKTLEANEFDLVFVHIGAGEKENDLKDKIIGNELDWINGLVGEIIQVTQPGSEIGSRLHFSLVMSYGAVSENDDSSLSTLISQKEKNFDISSIFPRQSFTMKGGNLLNNIRYHSPMLIAQWQEAVTRKDLAETFSFKEFKERGGNLTTPADRFLHEVAFKLWKAPKYGA
ncbi:hypothetical protein HHK36_025511 [Tetracentron sinense]|uniref:Uncharacterized protein n=1 Tax=Tetracentron sinense TaxID=13715 RepID=A0A835D3M5_TETSI|nr:hypothetical protein HHK36_025511 [Tetracentron sinense]